MHNQLTDYEAEVLREQAAEVVARSVVETVVERYPEKTREEKQTLVDACIVPVLKDHRGDKTILAATSGLNPREGLRFVRQIARRELLAVIGDEPTRPFRYRPRAQAPIGGAS